MHRIARWIDDTFFDLGRQLRWSYLPPPMVYLASGISGLTGIVGTFFVKEHFGFSAAFLAALIFWAGIPWALKMPIGHLVDLLWRWKAALVYLGAGLIALSILIMYGLIVDRAALAAYAPAETWYVLSYMLSPVGYVIQDTVADAMKVEAVPTHDDSGQPLPEAHVKAAHTTMQTLGRVAIIGGLVLVAWLNIGMFSGVEMMSAAEKAAVYAEIYLMALAIPAVSVLGVSLAAFDQRRRVQALRARGLAATAIAQILRPGEQSTTPDWWILGGGLAYVLVTLAIGLSGVPGDEEIIFLGSMGVVLFLIRRLLRALAPAKRAALVGTAVIIFVFRATPGIGAGATWWQIDVLGFDQRFIAVLTLISSVLTLFGMLALRQMMARRTIAEVVVLLTIAGTLLSLPFIGLFYGVQEWTAAYTGGIVDARFIAIINTALESPLGQLAMIPMLAWIAHNAPGNLKATFFAVMASFTNLALSAGALGTKYLNLAFAVTREVRAPPTGVIEVPADYSQLGLLMIIATAIGVGLPLVTIAVVQRTRLRTRQ